MNKRMRRSTIFVVSLGVILTFIYGLSFAEQQQAQQKSQQQQQPAAKKEAAAVVCSPFPQVLSLEPAILFQGDDKTLNLTGSNFDENMVFDFGRDIQAKLLKITRSKSSATLRVLVDKKAKTGRRNVYITLGAKKLKVANINVEAVVTPRILHRDVERERAGITGARVESVPPSAERQQQAPAETGPIVVVAPGAGALQCPGYPMVMAWIYNVTGEPPATFNITLIRTGDGRETPVRIARYSWNARTRRCDATWNIPPSFYYEGEYRLRVSAGEHSDESGPFYISYHRILSPEAGDVVYVTQRRGVSWFNTGLPVFNNPTTFFVSLINNAGATLWEATVGGSAREVEWLVGGICRGDLIAGQYCRGPYPGESLIPAGPYRMRVTRRTADGRDISVNSDIFEVRYPTMHFENIVNPLSPVGGSNSFFRNEPVEIDWTGDNFGYEITTGVYIRIIFPGGRTEELQINRAMSPSGGHLTWLPSTFITDSIAREVSPSTPFECRVVLKINTWYGMNYTSEPFYVSTGSRS